jgi:pimeloyl-ACP methyl ester carboxylesterase
MSRSIRILLTAALILFVGFTIFWYSRSKDVSFDAVRTEVPHAEYSHFADIDGVRIHYQEKGTGPVLVLLHGWGSSTYSWKDVFDPLSSQFRVIAVDQKGFGFSAKPEGDYTHRAQADLIVRLLDYLKIPDAVLCGNSMGGNVALNIARYYPQRVSRLILVDSSGIEVEGGSSTAPNILYWPVIGPAITAIALRSDALLRSGLDRAFYSNLMLSDERVAAYYRPLKTRRGQRAAYLAQVQHESQPIAPEIGKIQQPTLIIWGAEDRLIPVEAGRRFAATIKGSRLVVFEKCGHVPQEELPERFVREVLGFALNPA